METPKHETSFIKCYARPAKDGKIPGYQRRILLSSDGSLRGCPENDQPLEVVIMTKSDFSALMTELNRVDDYQNSINNKENSINSLNEKNDQLNKKLKEKSEENERLLKENISLKVQVDNQEDYKTKYFQKDDKLEKALVFIGLQRGIISEYKNRGWLKRLRNPEPEDMKQLTEPLDLKKD